MLWLTLSLALVGLLVGLAWFPCCGSKCPCISTPSTVSVTLTGWVDDACDCDVLNATHICDYWQSSGTHGTVGNYCIWKTDIATECTANNRNFTILAQASYSNALGTLTTYWNVDVVDSYTTVHLISYYKVVVIDDHQMDCTAQQTGFSVSSLGTLDACENPFSSTTCQVN